MLSLLSLRGAARAASRSVAAPSWRALSSAAAAGAPKEYKVEHRGKQVEGFTLRNEEDYRVFLSKDGKHVSPWHDVALYVDKARRVVNFVNEIPKGAVEKMEVATKEALNPIKQDVKKGKLRLYPFASLVNYGCLPQTWEDPTHKDASTGMLGDNDPLDVVEVGSRVRACGDVYPVKVLGVLGMVDEGEMDWKVIAIATDDPIADKVNSVPDLEKHQPGKVDRIVKWFKYYKVPDGKPVNVFAFDDQAKDAAFAMNVVELTHKAWANNAAIKAKGLWKP
jgi:inorganic pyrophosphatase